MDEHPTQATNPHPKNRTATMRLLPLFFFETIALASIPIESWIDGEGNVKFAFPIAVMTSSA